MSIHSIEHKSVDIPCLIQELQEQEIIDEYGNIDEIELTETYGEPEADNILKTISFNEIFKTVEVDKLYERAISCVQDIRLSLIRHRLHKEDVMELLSLYDAILEKEEE